MKVQKFSFTYLTKSISSKESFGQNIIYSLFLICGKKYSIRLVSLLTD